LSYAGAGHGDEAPDTLHRYAANHAHLLVSGDRADHGDGAPL